MSTLAVADVVLVAATCMSYEPEGPGLWHPELSKGTTKGPRFINNVGPTSQCI